MVSADAPIISLEEDSHSIKLNELDSESSVDQLTGEIDFEGYRVYRSIDGGTTWGNESDMIYDNNGTHVGWIPYAQFDYSLEQDPELYGQDVSGSDPVNPWFNLSNTGIQNNFEDIMSCHIRNIVMQ